MKLTTLEIKGFKSFGDKVLINFNEGVTAIVGPNGCGKSNVVDAIRWVLGEQSTRALRSDKMENVIFNGSRSRKASNLAEVSLTFDNTKNILPTEFSKVTITRKLFRSGDSEYRLNDVQCRLKDITDLFLDTGVGADSYSIIELKMIDEILNNKDNSRRTLFEEASGISKYKIRKKQTFNKLKDTETDLARVEDLLYEIEKNLKTLENQAKKTQRYYKIKEKYKELSTQLAAFRIHAFRTSLNGLQKQETEQDDKRLHFQTETDKTEALLQEEKKSSLLKEKNLSVQQKTTNEFVNSIRQYENEKKLKNEQLKFEQEKESRLQAELSNDKIWLERSHESILQLKSSLETENRELLSIETKLNKAKTALDKLKEEQLNAQQDLDEINTANRTLQEEAYKAEKEKDILSIQMETLEQELKRNSSDALQKREELSEFGVSINTLQKRIAEQGLDLTEAERFEESLQQSISQTENETQELKDKIAISNRSRDAKQNEYSLTKSLVDNLEGYPESIKFLRKNAAWAKNAPLLSDVLFCKEEYRIPIENYLEPFMNYYVVETYDEAIQAINLLSNASKGRANFFVLEAFKDSIPAKKENTVPENTLAALNIIDCDEKYRDLCRFLLNKVFLIAGDAEKTIRETDIKDAILLSQSGKYSRTKFSLSGGFTGLFEGKRIGRAKNLEVLQKEIKKLGTELEKNSQREDELSKQLEDLKASTKNAEITDIRSIVNTLANELLTLQTKEEQYSEFISNSETRREDIEAKLLEYTEKFDKINPLLADLTKQQEEAQERLLIAQRNHNQISEEVSGISADYNGLNITFHQQKNKITGLLKDLEYKESDAERYGTRIAKNTEELEITRKTISQILQTADHSDTDLLDMYEQKENLEKALAQAEEDYYDTKGIIGELENKIVELRRQKDQSDTITNEIREKKTQLKIELSSLKERLSVEFDIDIEDLLDQEDLPDLPEEELKQKSEKIKTQIETFGPINPMAMEAFSEMDERYKFIIKEKDDLMEAKTSLLNTIQEIDETAKAQFMDAFNNIRDNFQRVFRSLFNEEDSCDLFLVNPDDPLESPIEIVARPKGKRPLSINQLSGGEKTLTATAILFSLYLLKPAPFCIFDEVDAPLDDTNIDKFNNIIREFSKESQFIVVSHNKRTIASTDVVYGVTMVEQGISRVVPVDLRKFEDNAA